MNMHPREESIYFYCCCDGLTNLGKVLRGGKRALWSQVCSHLVKVIVRGVAKITVVPMPGATHSRKPQERSRHF